MDTLYYGDLLPVSLSLYETSGSQYITSAFDGTATCIFSLGDTDYNQYTSSTLTAGANSYNGNFEVTGSLMEADLTIGSGSISSIFQLKKTTGNYVETLFQNSIVILKTI